MVDRPTIWLNDFIVRLNPNPLQPLREPQITQLSNGNFLVCWTDSFNLDDTLPGSDLIAQIFDPLGVAIGGRIRINTNTADNESQPDIAALPGGGFVVVYLDPNSAGTTIRWNIRSESGALVSNGTVDRDVPDLPLVGHPQVAVLPDGSFAVTYIYHDAGPVVFEADRAVTKIFSAAGVDISGFVGIGRGQVTDVDTSVLANGDFLAAGAHLPLGAFLTVPAVPSEIFVEAITPLGASSAGTILARIVAATGVTFSEVRIAGLAPTLALPSTERFVVVFTSDSGARDDVVFSIFDGTQAIVSQRFVTLDSETDNEPAVIALADGGFFIVWDDDTNGRLEGQRFNAAGTTVGAQLLLATGAAAAPNLALTGDGRILVTWSELGAIHSMILDPRGNLITGTALNDVLVAPTESATVNGLNGDDRLFGSLFNDTLDGGTGHDTLFGRGGNDRLIGGAGHDLMDGGLGNDSFVGDAGNDVFIGGDGLDLADYRGSTAGITFNLLTGRGGAGLALGDTYGSVEAVFGSAFNDVLVGNSAANSFSGLDGDDTFLGLGGNDTLFGGFGNDTLNGGSGADTLAGSVGQDTASYAGALSAVTLNLTTGVHGGEALGDVLTGIEVIRGSSRDDLLTGGASAITLLGDAGNDTLTLGSGGGLMFGGAGNDTLFGTAANDTLVGGAGADLLLGGDGLDEVSYATSSQGVFASIRTGVTQFGDAQGDLFLGIESLRGSDFNDDLELGTPAGTLFGGLGDDMLRGGTGDDFLQGGLGLNTLTGGGGADTYFILQTTDVIVELSTDAGTDQILTDQDYVLAATISVEALLAFDPARTTAQQLTGNALVQSIRGNNGDNVLDTGGGAADVMQGLAGNDTYHVFNAGDSISELAGQGSADRVQADVSYTLAAGVDIEVLETLNATGTKAINLAGNTLSQTLTGNAGVNDLNGGAGAANTLNGLGGDDFYRIFNSLDKVNEGLGQGTNDRVAVALSYALDKFAEVEVLATLVAGGTDAIDLTGNDFSQRIVGNAGANGITGFGGNDTLVGGAGADTFVFFGNYGPTNTARIVDYSVADDQIRFDATDVAILPAGALAVAAFAANTTGLAQDASDRIIFQSNTGKLFFDADGAGGAAAVFFAQLTPNLAITAAEFNIFIAT